MVDKLSNSSKVSVYRYKLMKLLSKAFRVHERVPSSVLGTTCRILQAAMRVRHTSQDRLWHRHIRAGISPQSALDCPANMVDKLSNSSKVSVYCWWKWAS